MSKQHINDPDLKPMPEQVLYANVLAIGAWSAIVIMFITYGLYVLGVIEPHVPLEMVPKYWSHNVMDYMHATGSPHGWGWASLLGTGDFLNFIGLALLASMTIFCYLLLLPGYKRRKDYILISIVIAEVLVLVVAASGILGSGGH